MDSSGAAVTAESPYVAGDCLYYYRELATEVPIPFDADVLFQDDDLLVVDKPHFLPVMPSGRFLQQTLLVRLKKQFGYTQLVPLHRIDRGTAGVVAFSKNLETRGRYQSLFLKREVQKTYEAVAPTLVDVVLPLTRRSRVTVGKLFFLMREVEGAPNTETRIEVIEQRGAHSLYRLQPVTGKKHQLRVHLAALGAPIVNDTFYPQFAADADDNFSRPLQLLARTLAFDDPVTGASRRFESQRSL